MRIPEIYNYFLKSSSVCTDTRKINKDCIFFALKGDHFNGNTFALDALNKGAKYCVIDEVDFAGDKTILVDDVLTTLQELAKYHREQLNTPIIALTGSNGKTTTKELIHAVLSTKYNTVCTQGNFNNHIGVPLTLLTLKKDTEIGVIEMGANHQKEIEFLSNITLPDYGLITNFGKAHLEGFGGVVGVLKGKSELYDHLTSNDKLVFINDEDPIQNRQIGNYINCFRFGSKSHNDAIVKNITQEEFVTISYENEIIKSNLTGNYNFPNISIAVAIGQYFEVSKSLIKKGIESYVPSNNRSQIINNGNNKIILDAYNANPTSMKAAIDNFNLYKNLHKYAILGDMFELGETTKVEHQSLITYAENELDSKLYFIGSNFYECDISKSNSFKFKSYEDFEIHIKENVTLKDALILIKGSRGMRLERFLNYIQNS